MNRLRKSYPYQMTFQTGSKKETDHVSKCKERREIECMEKLSFYCMISQHKLSRFT